MNGLLQARKKKIALPDPNGGSIFEGFHTRLCRFLDPSRRSTVADKEWLVTSLGGVGGYKEEEEVKEVRLDLKEAER